MLRGLILAAALAAPWSVGAADALGTVTILEGEAMIYRGTERLYAAEGVRLALGDIVQTMPATFAQIELADRSVAQFGPGTRVMIDGSAPRQKPPRRWLYLMDGWAKLAGAKRDASAGPGFELRAPLFELPANAAVLVLRTSPAEVTLFVERGDVRLAERQARGAPIPVGLKGGDYYRRKASARGAVNPGGMQPFLNDMPRYFRDSLPLRADRYRDRDVRAREAPDFGYADVEIWLKAESSVRRPLMRRWRSKARDSAFRSALVSNLSSHPEWDPILFPEKYRPKDPPPVPRFAPSAVHPADSSSIPTYPQR